MHISEGVLSPAVLGGGAALAVVGTAIGLKKLDYEAIPRVAILSAAFFVASLIHVPVGPVGLHLVLNGLMGLLLGWLAVPAILIALFFQALLFQFGGLTVLGVNTVTMAAPAVLCFYAFRGMLRRGGRLAMAAAFACGAVAILLSGLLVAAALMFTGQGFLEVAEMVLLAHIPVMIIEGVMTLFAFLFLERSGRRCWRGFMPERKCCPGRILAASRVLVLLALLVLVCLATPALAHRVLVFAYAEGDTIHTESKFVPNDPVRQGKILVLDAGTGKELLTGTTDELGKFSFKIPPAAAANKMDLRIVIEAAMGHRGEWLLKAGSYLPGVPAAAAPAPAAVPAPVAAAPGDKPATVDQQALEAALQKTLERQLAPINEKLTDLTVHRTTLPDILGGIGYIVGFFGLAAYFMSKRQENP